MELIIDRTKRTVFITGYYNQTFKQIKKALKSKLGIGASEYKLIWDKLS